MYDTIMDQYHRALKRFREEINDSKATAKLKGLIARNGRHEETLSDVSFDIKIEDDWMERIEVAIPHLEAAIREDRQFIKSEGNISPIERVRKVSRASVEHLARHSEMITHVPDEGEDLIPDKLKVYENESNYAVYENRVLYMVICYARDFIDHRLFRISNAWKERSAEMKFAKKVNAPGGTIEVEFRLSDSTGGLADAEEENGRKIARIESMSGALAMLLNMPLMREMALAPMVSPPITRTNVLRMDTHFKEVVALYDFLSSYEGEGYSIEKRQFNVSPFPAEMEDELTDMIILSMYLNYKYGKDAGEELEARYVAEEQKREEERRRKFEELIKGGNLSPEQEKQLLLHMITVREAEIEKLRRKLSEANRMQVALQEAANKQSLLEDRIKQIMLERESVTSRLAAEKNQETMRAEGLAQTVAETARERDEQLAKNRYLSARINGLLEQYAGKAPGRDMSDREAFLELEKEREAFERFYEKNWKSARKKIRKRILWGRK